MSADRAVRRPDGTEELVRLSLPLPLVTAGHLMQAIARAAEEMGYTDVSVLTDGSQTIVATPPVDGVATHMGRAGLLE